MPEAHTSSQLLTTNGLVPVTFQVAIGKCNSKADLNYTISRAPDEKEVIRFKIDQQEVDFLANFCTELRPPSPTSAKPFNQSFELLTIASFLRKIVQKVVRLPVDLLIEDIRRTEAYQEYVEEYARLDVLMIQPSLVMSTQGTHRTLSAPSFVVPITTSAEYELHPVNTIQDLIIHRIDDAIPTEQGEQIDEGENVKADMFTDTMMLSQLIPGTNLEPRSNKKNLEEIIDEDDDMTDNDDHIDQKRKDGSNLPGILKKIDDALHVIVSKISIDATNDHLKDSLLKIISQDLATRIPKTIEELFKHHMESTISNVRSSSKASIASISGLQHRLYMKTRQNGEKNSKKQKSTFDSSSANVTTSTNPTTSKSEVVHKARNYATQPPIPAYDETWSKVVRDDKAVGFVVVVVVVVVVDVAAIAIVAAVIVVAAPHY
ncbi:hypothetical protein Tco_1219188 [Tanacetum coccineum]